MTRFRIETRARVHLATVEARDEAEALAKVARMEEVPRRYLAGWIRGVRVHALG